MRYAEQSYNTDFLEGAQPIAAGSPLAMRGDHYWWINDSSFSEYAKVEFPNYPGGLLEILDQHIGCSEANVGMDLAGGSQGYALGDLVNEGIIRGGLVTNLNNTRFIGFSPYAQLSHIAGDLATKVVWDRIIGWQQDHAPQGFSVVMHRPCAGLQDQSPEVYIGATHLLLDMIGPGGVLFTQVPSPLIINTPSGRTAYREIYSRSDTDKIILGKRTDKRFARHHAVVIKSKSPTFEKQQ